MNLLRGAMRPTLQSHWEMLIGRWEGPLAFRLLLQPMFAGAFAVRVGLRDARKLFITAVVVDLAYEILVFGRIFAGQSIIVAFVLAMPTYLVVRGPTNRVAQRIFHYGHSSVGENKNDH
jgi:hypothetical protein